MSDRASTCARGFAWTAGVALALASGCSSDATTPTQTCKANNNCRSGEVCGIDTHVCENLAEGRVIGRFTCRIVPVGSDDETIGKTDVLGVIGGRETVLSAAALCTVGNGLLQVEILEDPFYRTESHGLYVRVYEEDVRNGNVTVMLGPSTDKNAARAGHVRKFIGPTEDSVEAWVSSGRLVINEPLVEGAMVTGAVDVQVVLP